MNNTIQTIPLTNLALAFIPVVIVALITWKWALGWRNTLYAVSRMLGQLLLIGYVLIFIFDSDSALLITAILVLMVLTSSWIALRTVRLDRLRLYTRALFSVALGGTTTLFLITPGVIDLDPWYLPRYVIPLAGMIFANSLNSVSLAAERFYAERSRDIIGLFPAPA